MKQRILALFSMVLLSGLLPSIGVAETGSKAPVCALTSIADGQTINLQQFHGKVIYVDFWASWCAPCAKSFPFMNDLKREYNGRGLEIIGVNLNEANEEAKAFLEQYPADFTVAVDKDEKCAKDFQVKAMPSSYLIDRNGIIRHVHLGFRAGETQELKALVEQLLTESSELKNK